MFRTLGKSSVKRRAIWPLAGTVRIGLVNDVRVFAYHSVAKMYAAVVVGFAIAMPVFKVVSVSAAKSVAAIVSNVGSTPTSERRVVPDRNCRITVVRASEGE